MLCFKHKQEILQGFYLGNMVNKGNEDSSLDKTQDGSSNT